MAQKKEKGGRGGCCAIIGALGCLLFVGLLLAVLAIAGVAGYSFWRLSEAMTQVPEWTTTAADPQLAQRFDQRLDNVFMEAQTRGDNRFGLAAPVSEFNAYMAATLEQQPNAPVDLNIDSSGRLGLRVASPRGAVVMRGRVTVANGDVDVSDASVSFGGVELPVGIAAFVFQEALSVMNSENSNLPFVVENFATDGLNLNLSARLKPQAGALQ